MIIIDVREPNDVENWFKSQNLEVELKRELLEVGDYLIQTNNGKIVVERKTAGDYINSLIDGRLHTQLYEMSKNYPLSYLFVVGDIMAELAARDISSNIFYSSLIGCSLKRAAEGEQGQIVTIQLPTNYEVALCLYYLHKKLEENKLYRLPSITYKKSDFNSCLIRLYSCLPSVGEELAIRLAKQFPSLKSLLNASIQDLQKVEGIGEKKARQVYQFLHSD